MAVKLTNELVKRHPAPRTGSVPLWDKEVKGFGVRIYAPTARNPNGVRSYFVNYRIDARERRFTIGAHPTWSAEAARQQARALRKQIDAGQDVAAEKRERREAPTVADLVQRYIEDHLPTKAGKGNGRYTDELKMLGEIVARLGASRKVRDVHFGDVEAMHKGITESGRPVRANRILAVASKAFSLTLKPRAGEDKPWRDAAQGNPCRGVKKNPEQGRERFFSGAELAALSEVLGMSSADAATDCLKFLMLTGARPSEAMHAQWQHMDAEPGFWVKPSAHTKQRKEHKVPLNPAALELLQRLRAKRAANAGMASSQWVFPAPKNPAKPLGYLWAAWRATRERAAILLWAASRDEKIVTLVDDLRVGLDAESSVAECKAEAKRRGIELPSGLLDARIYDLRHTFASVGAAGGLSLPIIGRLLGHTNSKTTARYAHLGDDPLREATDKIGRVIAGAGKQGAGIVPINRGR